jgi:Ca-activated chloride channel family protein
MKRNVISIVMLAALTTLVWGQDRQVSGTVICSDDSSALFAVSIQMEGTSYGAITGEYGEYSITVPGDCPALVFHYLGKKAKRVRLSGDKDLRLDVALDQELVNLAEVTVVYDLQTQSVQGFTADLRKDTLEKIQPRFWAYWHEPDDHSWDLRWKTRNPEKITAPPGE